MHKKVPKLEEKKEPDFLLEGKKKLYTVEAEVETTRGRGNQK